MQCTILILTPSFSRPASFCTVVQSLAALARLNGTCPPQEPLALPPAQPAATEGPAGQPVAKKQGLGSALGNIHIARRFFILAYAFLVMCMVRRVDAFCVEARGGLQAGNMLSLVACDAGDDTPQSPRRGFLQKTSEQNMSGSGCHRSYDVLVHAVTDQ
jgi:hypothetical protein